MELYTLNLPSLIIDNTDGIDLKHSIQKKVLIADPTINKFIYSSYTSGYIQDDNSISHIKVLGDILPQEKSKSRLHMHNFGDAFFPIDHGKASDAPVVDNMLYDMRIGIDMYIDKMSNRYQTDKVEGIETYVITNGPDQIHDITMENVRLYTQSIGYPIALISGFKLIAMMVNEVTNALLPGRIDLYITSSGIDLKKETYRSLISWPKNAEIERRLNAVVASMEELRGYLIFHGMSHFWIRLQVNPISTNIIFVPTDRERKYATSFNVCTLQNNLLDGPDPYNIYPYSLQSPFNIGLNLAMYDSISRYRVLR